MLFSLIFFFSPFYIEGALKGKINWGKQRKKKISNFKVVKNTSKHNLLYFLKIKLYKNKFNYSDFFLTQEVRIKNL